MKKLWNLSVWLCCLTLIVGTAAAQSARSRTETPSAVAENGPAAQSADWFYERALIYHLKDEDGHATIELYKALDKQPDLMEANFFMGLLFAGREHWEECTQALGKVLQANSVNNLPARITLARARVEISNYQGAIEDLEKVAAALNIGKDFTDELHRCKADAALAKPEIPLPKKDEKDPSPYIPNYSENSPHNLKARLEGLLDQAQESLIETPVKYRDATVSMGLKDPLVYADLADLYASNDQRQEALKILNEALNLRKGFSPGILLKIGQIYQDEQRFNDALAVIERAVTQLRALGFSETKGDFSLEDLQQLKIKAKASKASESSAASGTGKSVKGDK
jgi:tetratricopeptide (TPR) repeat protein